MNLWTAFRVEVEKLARMKRVYLAALAVLLWTAFCAWGFHHLPQRRAARAAVDLGLDLSELLNGFLFARLGLELGGVLLLLPLFVCLVAGGQMAAETHDGTLRTLLTRPLPRWRLLAAKFAATAGYVLLLAGFLVGLLLGVGILMGGQGPLIAGAEFFQRGAGFRTLPAAACPLRFAGVALLLWAAYLQLAAFAFCFSCLTRHTSAAIVAALMIYLISVIMGSLPSVPMLDLFEEIKPFLPTRPMGAWRQMFEPEIPWDRVRGDLGRMAAFAAAFLGIALIVTDRKDVTA